MRTSLARGMKIRLAECISIEFEVVNNARLLLNSTSSVYALYDVEVVNGNTTTIANALVESSKDGSLALSITGYAGFKVTLDPPSIYKYTDAPTYSPSSSPTHALQVVYTGTQVR
jgi:hypothetical protein